MERNYHATTSAVISSDELDWRTAFHEAGHAAAIHIANQQKQLPPVFFEIQIKRPSLENQNFFAKVIDGNLIQNLPIAVVESVSVLSTEHQEQHSCQRAYQADVFNLLVGPLAEAKYVALRDNEVLNASLLSFEALKNYGGSSDLETARCYLECFIACASQREMTLKALLQQAFQFIEQQQNWLCIERFAQYILDSQQESISCDEAIDNFEQCLATRFGR